MKLQATLVLISFCTLAVIAGAQSSTQDLRTGSGDSGARVLGRSLNWTHVGREGQRQRGELAQGDEVLPQPSVGRVLRLEIGGHR